MGSGHRRRAGSGREQLVLASGDQATQLRELTRGCVRTVVLAGWTLKRRHPGTQAPLPRAFPLPVVASKGTDS